MVVPGLLISVSAEVTPRVPCAGSRSVSLLATFSADSAAVRPSAVGRHVAKGKAAVTSFCLRLPAVPAGDPPDIYEGRL